MDDLQLDSSVPITNQWNQRVHQKTPLEGSNLTDVAPFCWFGVEGILKIPREVCRERIIIFGDAKWSGRSADVRITACCSWDSLVLFSGKLFARLLVYDFSHARISRLNWMCCSAEESTDLTKTNKRIKGGWLSIRCILAGDVSRSVCALTSSC